MLKSKVVRLSITALSLLAMCSSVVVVAQNTSTGTSQSGKKQMTTQQKQMMQKQMQQKQMQQKSTTMHKTPSKTTTMHKGTTPKKSMGATAGRGPSMKKTTHRRYMSSKCMPMKKTMHRRSMTHRGRCTCGKMYGHRMYRTKKSMSMGSTYGRGPSMRSYRSRRTTCPPGYTMKKSYRSRKSMGAAYGRGRSTCPPGYTMKKSYRSRTSMGSSYGRGRTMMTHKRSMYNKSRCTCGKMYGHKMYRTRRSTSMGATYGRGPSMRRAKRVPAGCVPVRKPAHKRTTTHKRTMKSRTMTPPVGQGPSTMTPPSTSEGMETTTTPPAGAGPTEAAGAVCAAPISAIQARGHVENLCEEQAIGQAMISQNGAMCSSGDYKVAYTLDAPKGWYVMQNGRLTWQPPASCDTIHIDVMIMDSLTNKPLPIIPTVDVIDQAGNTVQSKQLQYVWSPMVDHYGANLTVPTSCSYTLRIHADTPCFARLDQTQGNRFTTPVDVTFRNVAMSAKPSTSTGAGPSEVTPGTTAPSGADTGTGTTGTTESGTTGTGTGTGTTDTTGNQNNTTDQSPSQ